VNCSILTRLAVFGLVALLTGCVGRTFETMYMSGLTTETTRDWRVVDVEVDVPETLTVSEEKVLVPHADIVWREDGLGNRYEQVSRIVAAGVRDGSRPLRGSHDVRLEVTVRRFHAMTLEAEALNFDVGVHGIDFDIRVVDSKSGTVLVPSEFIRAEFPALTGIRMTEARLRGETQKSQIERHLARVTSGWLGIGPDPRIRFTRIGS
jgi:hypothetical protein